MSLVEWSVGFNTDADRIWCKAQDWLVDFGIHIGTDEELDAYDEYAPRTGGYLFRIRDGCGGAIIVDVVIDEDADYDGERYVDRSRVDRVTIRRER